jgi:hypothetical protein|nr:hypothetical protein [Neorhizobium tomejilense]
MTVARVMTVTGIALIAVGTVASLMPGVSAWGIAFPIGATALFAADQLDARS